jgi:hypothetical protein
MAAAESKAFLVPGPEAAKAVFYPQAKRMNERDEFLVAPRPRKTLV